MDKPVSIEKHRDKVFSTMKELNIPINYEFEAQIQNLDSNQLRQLYLKLWHFGNRDKFCELYNINSGNFHKWLKDKKGSPTSMQAVRQFLLDGPPGKLPPKLPVTIKQPPIKQQIQVLSFEDVISKFSKLDIFPISALCIIDGDHCSYKVQEIAPLAQDYDIQVIVCLANTHLPGLLHSFSSSWLTICQAKTSSKDAADSLIHGLAFTLYSTSFANSNIPLIVVSGDEIFTEMVNNLATLSHFAYHLSPIIPLAGWFLFTSFPSSFNQKYSNKLYIVNSIYSKLVNCILSSLQASTVSQAIKMGEEKLNEEFKNSHISPIIPTKDMITVYVMYKKCLSGKIDVNSLSEEELRLEYFIRWSLDIKVFCQDFQIKPKKFSAWLHRQTLTNKEISNKVREWLTNI